MLHRINELLANDEVFAFETTLATKSYKKKVISAQEKDYKVVLLFFWLDNVDPAIERGKTRVQEGGHNIEIDVIKRRYKNGITDLFDIYLPIVNEALIFDNTAVKAELIAQKTLGNNIEVIDEIKFDKLKNNHYERRQTNNDSNSEKDYRGNG